MEVRRPFLVVAVLMAAIGCPAAMAQEGPPRGTGPVGAPPTGTPAPALAATAPTGASAPGGLLFGMPASTPDPYPPPGSTWSPVKEISPATPPAHFTPFMLGDFVGLVANQFSDLKIAEGESPRPTDRVFYRFNYFNNLNKSRWTDPTQPIHNVDLYRSVFGMEKTFFDQRVSLGLRLPFNTIDAQAKDVALGIDPTTGAPGPVPGGPGYTTTQFGNISAILKAVLGEDRETGSLFSAGAILSLPTASSRKINPGSSTLAYVQPFGGFILNRGDFFVQGFTSITFPLAQAESIVLFNDVGVGYYVYRAAGGAGWLTAVTPTFEVHVATPLRQVDPSADIFGTFDALKVYNVVDLTLGTTVEFMYHTTLGVGVVVPVTGPKPFDVEALAQLNYRF